MRRATLVFSCVFLMIQSLGLIVLANTAQAQEHIQPPISACSARFENTDAGTHGWWGLSDRSDYA